MKKTVSSKTKLREKTEKETIKLAERLNLATHAAQMGIWDWDIQKNELVWDDQMYRLYGIEPGAFGGAYEAWLNGVHPDDRAPGNHESQMAVRGEKEYDTEFRVLWPDGSIHWLKANGQVFWDEKGNPLRMVGVNYDITNRRQAEERLKESEEYLRLGYEAGDLGIWKNDLQTGTVEFDERARIHYGFDTLHTTLAEVTNRIHPDDLARVGTEIEAATSPNGSGKFSTEYRVVHADGSVHWLAIGVQVLFEGEGAQRHSVIGYGTTQDITARKQTEIKLSESEEKFAALFYHAAMPAALLAIPQRLAVDVNTAFENMSGYRREELIGKNPVQIGMAPTAETQQAFHEFQEKGTLIGVEGRFFTKSGEARDILINANLVELGGQKYALLTYQNITERKQAEKRVIQMKRLYATLSQVNQAIVRVKSHADLYQSICDVCTTFGEFALAWIGILDAETGDVTPVAASGLDLEQWPFPQINIRKGAFKNGLIATAFLTSNVVTSEDVMSDERTSSSAASVASHNYHAAAIVPFQLRGKTIGVLSLVSHDAKLFTAQEEALLLKEMGGDISFALDTMETEAERKLAEEKIEKQNERLTILREIDVAILSADALESIVGSALKHIRELIDCRRANLTLIDHNTAELVIFEVSTAGETSIPAGRRLPLAQFEDILQTLSQNKPIIFNDYRTIADPRPGIQSLMRDGLLSTCSLPLLSKSGLIGMLSMHSDIPGFFDDGKVALGSEVANQVAIAIVQMQLTQALAKNEERLRLSLHAARQGLYDLNVQTGEAIVNREYAEMLGYDPDTFTETNAAWIERLHPDDKPITANVYTDYINGLLPEYRVEFRQKTKQGDWKWILSVGSIVEYDGEEKPLRMLGTHTDIHQIKEAERQIVQMKRLYATLSQVNQTIVRAKSHADLYQSICDVCTTFGEFALAWIGLLDEENGDIKPVAASGLELAQWPFAQINLHEGPFKNGLISDAIHTSTVITSEDIMSDERTSSSAAFVASHNYHATAIVPFQLRGKTIGVLSLVSHDAKLFTAQEEALLLKEMGGDISFALDTMETESEREQAELKLRESEENYKALFESNPHPMWVFDLETLSFLTVNEAAIQHYGYSREEFLSMNLLDIRPAEDHQQLLEIATDADEGLHKAGYWQHIKKDGSLIDVEITVHTLDYYGRKAKIALANDITERKQAEDALKESEARFSKVFFTNPVAQSILSTISGQTVEVNDACCRLYEYSREELIGTDPGSLDLWAKPAEQLEVLEELQRTGRLLPREITIRPKSGEIRTILFSVEQISWKGEPCLVTSSVDITERKRAEEALRLSQLDLQAAQAVARVGSWKWDLKTREITWSDEMYHIFGIDKNSYTGRLGDVISKVIHPDDLHIVQPSNAANIANEPIEYRIILPDGSIHHIWAKTGEAILDGTGKPTFLTGIAQDITARKQAEQKLSESEVLLRQVLESVPDSTFALDRDYRLLIDNQRHQQELIASGGHPFAVGEQMLSPDYPAEVLEFWRVAYDRALNGETFTLEGSWGDTDGQTHVHENLFSPLRGANGAIIGALVVAHDITLRKQAENALREREQKLNALLNLLPVGVSILDQDQKVAYSNDALGKILGITKEGLSHSEYRNRKYLRADGSEKPAGEFASARAFAEKIEIHDVITGIVKEDAQTIWTSVSAVPVDFPDWKVILVTSDVTERKQAESKIQEQLLRLRGLHIIDQAINSNFDMKETLNVVLKQMKEMLGVDAAAILLVDEQKQLLECATCQGFSSMEMRNTQLKLSEGYAGRAISEKRTIHVPNLLETGGALADALKRAGDDLLDYFGTPLIAKGNILGVMEIYFHTHINPDPEWLTFFEMLAGQAAIAIENSKLIERLKRSAQELEQRVKARTAELQHVNTELEYANRTKDEFLANMSHELRTPLTGILGLTESILLSTYGQPNEKQSKALKNIESSGRHLLELINDILDLSKIESNKFEIYPDLLNIEETCRASLIFIREQAAKKSIQLEYQDTKEVKSVFADPRRLKQILVNLLSNAVKFTPEKGKVTLAVRADPEKGQIHFSVIDTGIGIKKEDLDRLFTPFTQVDSRLNRQYDGTGLGLVLVLRLAEMHGGNVQVETEPGKGSCFTVSLPWQAQVNKPIETQQTDIVDAPVKSATTSQGLVLLAEDNPANIEAIGDYLQFKGYTLVLASNGIEALVKAEESNPDLILMDIQMPVMDGLEAIRRLRADPRFTSTPIIALTALAMTGDRERCIEAGATDYLSKPVSLKELAKKIEKLLQP